MQALCTQLLKPSVPSLSIVESSKQARSTSSKFLICNGGLGESCTPPEIVLYCVDCVFVHVPWAAFPK